MIAPLNASAGASGEHSVLQNVVAATPPKPAPEGTATRAPLAENYQKQEPSTARPKIEGDPYREQVS